MSDNPNRQPDVPVPQGRIQPLTTRGTDIEQAKEISVQLATETIQQIQDLVDSGQWSAALQRTAQIGTLQAATLLQESMHLVKPDYLTRVQDSFYGIAKTEANQSSRITSNLSLSLGSSDLSRDDLLALMAPKAPKRSTRPAKDQRTNDTSKTPEHSQPTGTIRERHESISHSHTVPIDAEVIDCTPVTSSTGRKPA